MTSGSDNLFSGEINVISEKSKGKQWCTDMFRK